VISLCFSVILPVAILQHARAHCVCFGLASASSWRLVAVVQTPACELQPHASKHHSVFAHVKYHIHTNMSRARSSSAPPSLSTQPPLPPCSRPPRPMLALPNWEQVPAAAESASFWLLEQHAAQQPAAFRRLPAHRRYWKVAGGGLDLAGRRGRRLPALDLGEACGPCEGSCCKSRTQ
jgi:hypothetical protein